MSVDQLKDAFAASLDVALERGHFAKLVRSHPLGKKESGADSRLENFTMQHGHLAPSVRTKNETAARKFKSNWNGLPGRFQRPRAPSCQAISLH
jgi:hypothetical protein